MTLVGWLLERQGILAFWMYSIGYAQRVFSVMPSNEVVSVVLVYSQNQGCSPVSS